MAFNAGTLPNIDSCATEVQGNLNRGTLSATSKPTLTQVHNWLIRAKEKLAEEHGYSWRRVFAYMDTSASSYRYSLPSDFGEGGFLIRDTTQDIRLNVIDPVSFDSFFVDVAGSESGPPLYATVKSNELWLSKPANGVYRFELEYDRTGDDTSPADVSYLPEGMRFKICDYATYRGFIALEMWEAAAAYKTEWTGEVIKSKQRDTRKKWKSRGYKTRHWLV